MPYLVIDEPHRSALVKIAEMQDREIADLASAVSALPLTTNRARLLSAISSRATDIPEPTLDETVNALLYLHSVGSTSGVLLRTFVTDICASMVRGPSEAVLDETKRSSLEERLLSLLSIEDLRRTSKAMDLAFDYPSIFQSVRILTDMRPVFKGGAELAMEGGLIDHTMKITYYSDEGSREIYLALDGTDIEAIKRALDRAEKKAAVLKSLMARSDIPNLNEGRSEDKE